MGRAARERGAVQNVKASDVEQFKDPKTEVILWPPALKSGDVRTPYSDAKH